MCTFPFPGGSGGNYRKEAPDPAMHQVLIPISINVTSLGLTSQSIGERSFIHFIIEKNTWMRGCDMTAPKIYLLAKTK